MSMVWAAQAEVSLEFPRRKALKGPLRAADTKVPQQRPASELWIKETVETDLAPSLNTGMFDAKGSFLSSGSQHSY